MNILFSHTFDLFLPSNVALLFKVSPSVGMDAFGLVQLLCFAVFETECAHFPYFPAKVLGGGLDI